LWSARDGVRHPFHKTRLPVSASRLAQDMKLSSRYIFHDGRRGMVPRKNVFVPQAKTINSIPIFKLRASSVRTTCVRFPFAVRR